VFFARLTDGLALPLRYLSPLRYGFIKACGTLARLAMTIRATMAITYGSIR
jgi:hypothetical protein